MKRGFISMPLILGIVILLVLAGGAYVVLQNQPVRTNTLSETEILAQLSNEWETVQATITIRPALGQSVDPDGIWGYTDVQFIGNNAFLIAFEDGHNAHKAVLSFGDGRFVLEEVFQNQSAFTATKWQELVNTYGDPSYPIGSYARSIVRDKKIVTFPELTKVPENIFIDYLETNDGSSTSSVSEKNGGVFICELIVQVLI